jgi:hypothetical protein
MYWYAHGLRATIQSDHATASSRAQLAGHDPPSRTDFKQALMTLNPGAT